MLRSASGATFASAPVPPHSDTGTRSRRAAAAVLLPWKLQRGKTPPVITCMTGPVESNEAPAGKSAVLTPAVHDFEARPCDKCHVTAVTQPLPPLIEHQAESHCLTVVRQLGDDTGQELIKKIPVYGSLMDQCIHESKSRCDIRLDEVKLRRGHRMRSGVFQHQASQSARYISGFRDKNNQEAIGNPNRIARPHRPTAPTVASFYE